MTTNMKLDFLYNQIQKVVKVDKDKDISLNHAMIWFEKIKLSGDLQIYSMGYMTYIGLNAHGEVYERCFEVDLTDLRLCSQKDDLIDFLFDFYLKIDYYKEIEIPSYGK